MRNHAGVGRSLNYYPINDELPEEGVAEVAIGLGKYIVDGGRALCKHQVDCLGEGECIIAQHIRKSHHLPSGAFGSIPQQPVVGIISRNQSTGCRYVR